VAVTWTSLRRVLLARLGSFSFFFFEANPVGLGVSTARQLYRPAIQIRPIQLYRLFICPRPATDYIFTPGPISESPLNPAHLRLPYIHLSREEARVLSLGHFFSAAPSPAGAASVSSSRLHRRPEPPTLHGNHGGTGEAPSVSLVSLAA
jgi:hypothetical protein